MDFFKKNIVFSKVNINKIGVKTVLKTETAKCYSYQKFSLRASRSCLNNKLRVANDLRSCCDSKQNKKQIDK